MALARFAAAPSQFDDAVDALQRAQVVDDVGVFRDAQRIVFERRHQRRHVLAVPSVGELDLCDAVAVAVMRGFGEVLAVAACVKPRRSQAWQAVEQVIDNLPLLCVRDVA